MHTRVSIYRTRTPPNKHNNFSSSFIHSFMDNQLIIIITTFQSAFFASKALMLFTQTLLFLRIDDHLSLISSSCSAAKLFLFSAQCLIQIEAIYQSSERIYCRRSFFYVLPRFKSVTFKSHDDNFIITLRRTVNSNTNTEASTVRIVSTDLNPLKTSKKKQSIQGLLLLLLLCEIRLKIVPSSVKRMRNLILLYKENLN